MIWQMTNTHRISLLLWLVQSVFLKIVLPPSVQGLPLSLVSPYQCLQLHSQRTIQTFTALCPHCGKAAPHWKAYTIPLKTNFPLYFLTVFSIYLTKYKTMCVTQYAYKPPHPKPQNSSSLHTQFSSVVKINKLHHMQWTQIFERRKLNKQSKEVQKQYICIDSDTKHETCDSPQGLAHVRSPPKSLNI